MYIILVKHLLIQVIVIPIGDHELLVVGQGHSNFTKTQCNSSNCTSATHLDGSVGPGMHDSYSDVCTGVLISFCHFRMNLIFNTYVLVYIDHVLRIIYYMYICIYVCGMERKRS